MNSELALVLGMILLCLSLPLSLAGITKTMIDSQTEKKPQPKEILYPIIIFIMVNIAFYLLFLV